MHADEGTDPSLLLQIPRNATGEISTGIRHWQGYRHSPAVLLPLDSVQEELADDVGGAVALGAVLLVHHRLQLLLVPVVHPLLPFLTPSPVHSRKVLSDTPLPKVIFQTCTSCHTDFLLSTAEMYSQTCLPCQR